MVDEKEVQSTVTYEELAELEHGFDAVDVEIIRQQHILSKELYARRRAIVSKIPGFWPLVLESAPPEIDRYIQPSDSEIFATALKEINVERFELGAGSSGGDPRSLEISFVFDDNAWFEDRVLTKKFWWRRAADGWTGLVSEPVEIRWKAGKDPTKGLMQGALNLWRARQSAGNMARSDVAEAKRMERITETWNGENTSFFTWFAFVSGRRWVSREESEAAVKAEARRRQGEEGPMGTTAASAPAPEADQAEMQLEAHEDGESLATVIAEDLWPGAIRYFTMAQEEDSEGSEEDFVDSEDEEEQASDDGGRVSKPNLRKVIEGADGDRAQKRQRKG